MTLVAVLASCSANSAAPHTIWPNTIVPAFPDSGPDAAVELGVSFRADTNGYIIGIRFYKSAANTGTHVGNLWSSTGALLATATFTRETASGWQQVNFSNPVAIMVNTVYVASYHANGGHWSADWDYFANSGVDNAPLHAPANGSSAPNGRYAYGSSTAFPANTNSANYWVDVVFNSVGPTPVPVSTTSPPNATQSVLYHIWPSTAVPAFPDSGPDAAVELGVSFRADTDGYITGMRFYKSAANTGTHVGHLWSNTGTLLATATFTRETAAGWQRVNFSNPVAITANTVYVASYHANGGHWSADWDYFANSGVDNAPLHAPANGSGAPNGRYAYGSSTAFPTNTNSANYWVDVNFATNAGVVVAPSISTQPASQTVKAAQTATFTVAATGTAPMSYQWRKNSVVMSGATSSSYTTPGTTSSDNGAQFTVVVSNTAGSVTSNAATLTVNAVQPSAAKLSAVPASVGFGNVAMATTNTQTIALTNSGTSSLTISQAPISGTGFSTNGLTLPLTLSQGQSAKFNVAFTPASAGTVSGSVSLVSDAANSTLAIPLSGTGLAASLLLGANPTSLNFGNVNVSTSNSLGAVLTNNGNSNVTISSVTFTATGISISGVTPGTILTPNQSATLNVAFAPAATGNLTGNVTVRSNATNSPTTIALTGSGVSPLPAVAFPGAQGGGALSLGGRGGTVYLVTNTGDSGAGTLRACIDASGPRTCVFRTGGTIALQSSLNVANPFITIAGQTAPGGGIQISGPGGSQAAGNPSLMVTTHDVVVQYLRVRRGHNAGEVCNQNPWSCGASVEVLSWPGADPYNIAFDHVSMEWSNYDAMIILGSHPGANSSEPRSITVSHSIIGEELAGAGQTVGANFGGYSGDGSTVPDLMTDLDVHHSLFVGTTHRMPLMTVKSGRLVNNFVYAWTYYPMRSKGFRDFVGNYYKYRSGQGFVSHEIQAWTTNDGNDTSFAPSFYVAGNMGPSDPTGTSNWSMTAQAINESAGEGSSPLSTSFQRGSPIPTPAGYIPITSDPAATIGSVSGPILNIARTALYDAAGASRKLTCNGTWADAVDPVDSRILNAVANGTNLFGSYDYSSLSASPQSQADLGGWPTLAAGTACVDSNNNGLPDVWESYWGGVFGLGSTLDPNGLNFGDGYTNLEHYMNGVSPAP